MKRTFAVAGKTDDAERLARMLGCPMNKDAEVVVRYGTLNGCKGKLEINSELALNNARDKFVTLALFRAHDLPVPEFSLSKKNVRYPALARRFHHQCGTDIIFMNAERDFTGRSNYYIEFMPIQTEYRAHIVCGKVISLAEKVGGSRTAFCRNLKTGWKFAERKEDQLIHPDVVKLARKAVRALKLHFGAVDVLISNGKPYLLEVNTAPGIIDRRAELYAEAIKEYVRRL